jgi:RNA polymerase sigma-70 factor (ECF subfamily)
MDVDLNACVNGDKRAWDAFVDRFAGVIHAAVVRTCRGGGRDLDREDLHDIVQDVFVRLVRDDYRLLRRFDPAKASLVTWLTIVARSAAIDHLRRRRHDAAALDALPEPVDGSPSGNPEAGDTAELMPAGLLTDRQRLVLHLLFDRDLTVDDVAEVLGVDPQTVRSTKHKALVRLREHFATDSSGIAESQG